MRVLFQPRAGFEAEGGGETISIRQLVQALRHAGTQVDISTDPRADLSAFDLVQLREIWAAETLLAYLGNARRQNKPVVLAPVYWNVSRYEREKWRMLSEWLPDFREGADSTLAQQSETARQRVDFLSARILVHGASALLPASHMEEQQLGSDFGAPSERFKMVYSGVDPIFYKATPDPFIQEYGLRDFVLCVGRIEERKNQFSLIRALKGTGLRLVLIGQAPDPRYLQACRREGGAGVLILPSMPQAKLASAYAAAKVHALVSWMESASLANLEAGLAGCNIVADAESSAREYYGEQASYCDPSSYASIRGAVLEAYNAPRQQGLAEHILAHYTWERVAEQLIEAYEFTLALRPCPVTDTELVQELLELAQAHHQAMELKDQLTERLWNESNALRRRRLRL